VDSGRSRWRLPLLPLRASLPPIPPLLTWPEHLPDCATSTGVYAEKAGKFVAPCSWGN